MQLVEMAGFGLTQAFLDKDFRSVRVRPRGVLHLSIDYFTAIRDSPIRRERSHVDLYVPVCSNLFASSNLHRAVCLDIVLFQALCINSMRHTIVPTFLDLVLVSHLI